ncbi:unnamed protein product [Symbiodinium natans]|uniref:Uncharacterized protein n=1 Tax=Symbiodinium natans TaxID=878477 RepID=A0A812QYL8_9DINO|nr:unnamed protein product [Symbiodinium natans]
MANVGAGEARDPNSGPILGGLHSRFRATALRLEGCYCGVVLRCVQFFLNYAQRERELWQQVDARFAAADQQAVRCRELLRGSTQLARESHLDAILTAKDTIESCLFQSKDAAAVGLTLAQCRSVERAYRAMFENSTLFRSWESSDLPGALDVKDLVDGMFATVHTAIAPAVGTVPNHLPEARQIQELSELLQEVLARTYLQGITEEICRGLQGEANRLEAEIERSYQEVRRRAHDTPFNYIVRDENCYERWAAESMPLHGFRSDADDPYMVVKGRFVGEHLRPQLRLFYRRREIYRDLRHHGRPVFTQALPEVHYKDRSVHGWPRVRSGGALPANNRLR